jgi:hypothetical protein
LKAPTSDAGRWREAIYELALFSRPSASDGERRAAQWIAGRLRQLGCEAEVEQERAHGGYWSPIGLANTLAGAGALLALRRRGALCRAAAAVVAGGAAVALWDDLGHGSRWFRRRLLPVGSRSVVPGANDNLSAVGVLIAVAAALQERPLEGLRVLLLSTGSEESFSEGMQAFGERHFPELDRERTEFLCLECLGGPNLVVLEGEGMLKMRDYPERMRDALAEAAADAGVGIQRGIRTVAATDGIIALRAGYPIVTLASVTDVKLPLNYHWPSDVPEGLCWDTIEDAIAVCEAFVRLRSAADQPPRAASEPNSSTYSSG